MEVCSRSSRAVFQSTFCLVIERVPANYKMPLDTVLCLDTSASMGFNNNEGINQLKAAALKFLEGVEETARQADLKVGLRTCFNPKNNINNFD